MNNPPIPPTPDSLREAALQDKMRLDKINRLRGDCSWEEVSEFLKRVWNDNSETDLRGALDRELASLESFGGLISGLSPAPLPPKAETGTPQVLGHPATAEWCRAVDEHHAATEQELNEAKAELARLLGVRKTLSDRAQERIDNWVTVADKERVRAETAEADLTAARTHIAGLEAETSRLQDALRVEREWTAALTRDNGILIEAADKTRAGAKCIALAGQLEKARDDLARLSAQPAPQGASEGWMEDAARSILNNEYFEFTEKQVHETVARIARFAPTATGVSEDKFGLFLTALRAALEEIGIEGIAKTNSPTWGMRMEAILLRHVLPFIPHQPVAAAQSSQGSTGGEK